MGCFLFQESLDIANSNIWDTHNENSWDTNLEANFTSRIQFMKERVLSQGSPAGMLNIGNSFNCFQD
eukprot:6898202-Prorocentrum_lima.AAC.1